MLALLLLTVAATSQMAEPTTARLADNLIRVRDVAVTRSGGALPLLKVPVSGVTLTAEEMRQLVANRLPGVSFDLRHTGQVRFLGVSPPKRVAQCWRVLIDIEVGARISGDAVESEPCSGRPDKALVAYDRDAHHAIARQRIPVGTNLGQLRILDRSGVKSGQPMVLHTAIGAVTIERRVTALQPARTGARVFARTVDGIVVSSRVTEHSEDDR